MHNMKSQILPKYLRHFGRVELFDVLTGVARVGQRATRNRLSQCTGACSDCEINSKCEMENILQ